MLRPILVVALLLGAACTTDTPPTGSAPSPSAPPERPNVLLVVTDDMRPDGLAAMPFTTRWLAGHGRSYTNAYATTPLCCPSRASIFTGRYAHNHGVLKNQDSHDLDTGETIQAYLGAQTDYRTGLVGKYLNSWSVEEDPPQFDMWASYSGRYYGKPFNINGRTTTTDSYSTSYIAARAQQFLGRSDRQDDDRPWFLYVAPVAPHAPFTVAPQHKAARVPLIVHRASRAPSLEERDLSDKPDIPRRPFSLESTRKLRKKQWRTLLSVDDMMRKLRASLEDLGEEADTIVIFTSDQGLLQGEHGLFAKRLPYTESIQVPLLVRWPGHVERGTEDRLVANIDLAATIGELAGVEADQPMDGVSLLSGPPRDELLIEQLENWRVGLPDWRSIRALDYQYVEYYTRSGDVMTREYYDLRADPWQLRNLLGDDDADNDPDVAQLSALVKSYRSCAGDGCVNPR